MKWTFSIALLFLLSSCKQNSKLPDDFDFGKIIDSVYLNQYFKFEIPVPKGWAVQSQENLKKIMDEGVKIVEEKNKKGAQATKAAMIRSATLFGAFRYPSDSLTGKFNSSVLITAENLSGIINIKNERDYLEVSRTSLEKSGLKYKIDDDIIKKSLGAREFYGLRAETETKGIEIKQEFYVSIIEGFAVMIAITYSDYSEKDEMNKILESIRFK